MFKKKESAEVIARQGTELVILNNKLIAKQTIIDDLTKEVIDMYAELKEVRLEKENCERRVVEFARKIKAIEDLIKSNKTTLSNQLKKILASESFRNRRY